ncbi:MAG: hypothetical protein DWQ37_01920 [Planctomycetota bacterium]|nr:MAG: hypothetical protein DWQ37_01920 [Planctomycetota bacterium]
MYLKYGNYQHAPGEASVVISRQAIFTEAGIVRGTRERWDVQGQLQAADPAALSTAIDALAAAYAVQDRDVGFYFDDGQPSSHRIESAATHGGVRVVVPPSFPQGRGAEYTTFRNYTLALEAEWIDPQATVLNWHEAISFQGGGPQFAFLQPINGPPVKQLLRQATPYRASQSGQAVGQLGYPAPAAPIWPGAEHVDRRQIHYELPKRMGPPGSPSYTQFKVTWSYQFEDAGPLAGSPTSWPV